MSPWLSRESTKDVAIGWFNDCQRVQEAIGFRMKWGNAETISGRSVKQYQRPASRELSKLVNFLNFIESQNFRLADFFIWRFIDKLKHFEFKRSKVAFHTI